MVAMPIADTASVADTFASTRSADTHADAPAARTPATDTLTPTPTKDRAPSTESKHVHRLRLIPYTPSPITCIASTPIADDYEGPHQVVICRQNGDIQVFQSFRKKRCSHWEVITTIPSVNQQSWSSVVLALTPFERASKKSSARIYTSSLNGTIVEWAQNSLHPRHVVDNGDQAVLGISLNRRHTLLAAALENGDISLWKLVDESDRQNANLPLSLYHARIARVRTIPAKVPVTMTSVAFDAEDPDILYAGNANGQVFRYSASEKLTEQLTYQMRSFKRNLILSICSTAGTLVIGDSHANVVFLDPMSMSEIQKFRVHSHASWINGIAATTVDDEVHVFSIGSDALIVHYTISGDGSIRYRNRKRHGDYDLLAATVAWGPSLAVAGNNATLSFFRTGSLAKAMVLSSEVGESPSGRTGIREGSGCGMSSLKVAGLRRAILYAGEDRGKEGQYTSRVKLYALAKTIHEPVCEPKVHFELVLKSNEAGDYRITATEISPDGRWIAVSRMSSLLLYYVTYDEQSGDALKVKRALREEPTPVTASTPVHILDLCMVGGTDPNSFNLVVTYDSGAIVQFVLRNSRGDIPPEIERRRITNEMDAERPIIHMTKFPEGGHVWMIDTESYIHILDVRKGKMWPVTLSPVVVGIKYIIGLKERNLVVITLDDCGLQFSVPNLAKGTIGKITSQVTEPRGSLSQRFDDQTSGAFPLPWQESTMLVYSRHAFGTMRMPLRAASMSQALRGGARSSGLEFQDVLFMGMLDRSEIVVVERPAALVRKTLGNPMERRIFGQM